MPQRKNKHLVSFIHQDNWFAYYRAKPIENYSNTSSIPSNFGPQGLKLDSIYNMTDY